MKKILYIAIAVMASVLLLCGCSEADRANSNISKQADYFESERKITVYNARTDKVIMEAEGYMSISNNSHRLKRATHPQLGNPTKTFVPSRAGTAYK